MTYPVDIDIGLIQEDFIEVDMLENIVDSMEEKKEALKVYIWQTVGLFIVALVLFFSSWAAKASLVFPLFFWICVSLNFVYRYFYGCKNELNLAISHLVEGNEKGLEFFTPEVGKVSFYEDKCEYLTNEERRYFEYSFIQHIKQTKRLFIFVIKAVKDKSVLGFSYMIIPKRDLDQEQFSKLEDISKGIVEKYDLLPWIENTIFD